MSWWRHEPVRFTDPYRRGLCGGEPPPLRELLSPPQRACGSPRPLRRPVARRLAGRPLATAGAESAARTGEAGARREDRERRHEGGVRLGAAGQPGSLTDRCPCAREGRDCDAAPSAFPPKSASTPATAATSTCRARTQPAASSAAACARASGFAIAPCTRKPAAKIASYSSRIASATAKTCSSSLL